MTYKMDIKIAAFTRSFFMFNWCFSTCFMWHCGTVQNITHAKIPGVNKLLSLSDFEKYIVNQEMGRMYVASKAESPMANTPVPDINFVSTITKLDGTSNYQQKTFGETPGVNTRCSSSNTSLTRLSGSSDSAIFTLEDRITVLAFWSSCPTSYVWGMKCSKYNIGHKKCLLKDVMFGIYVHGTLDDVPMDDIVKDLCGATDVKFGVRNFRWVFTYGQNINMCRLTVVCTGRKQTETSAAGGVKIEAIAAGWRNVVLPNR